MNYTNFPQLNNFNPAGNNSGSPDGSFVKKYAQGYKQGQTGYNPLQQPHQDTFAVHRAYENKGDSPQQPDPVSKFIGGLMGEVGVKTFLADEAKKQTQKQGSSPSKDTYIAVSASVSKNEQQKDPGYVSKIMSEIFGMENIKPMFTVKVNRKRIRSNEGVWLNDLRQTLSDNKAVIMAMTPRTFNAEDKDGNGLIDLEKGETRGSFLNAIERLDELKGMGVNTIHLLPINPPAKERALGTAGSLYAPESYTEIDPALDDPDDPRNVYEEAREFIKEAHKRNIRVMVDLPSCASIPMAEENPELIAFNKDGSPKVPQGWNDIRAFKVWKDKENDMLNQPLMEIHKGFVDMIMDIGADGIRADVARYKPPKFWKELIGYAREKDPQFGFLAESYTYEDASPMANIPADRPESLLNSGFDSIYGQYHIFPSWNTAGQLHGYVKKMIDMSHRLPPNKSLIGSFATHDDKAPISNGGVPYCNMTVGLQATLPMTNPYFVSGFESGDNYVYKFRNKYVEKSETDSNIAFVHPEWIDIFNYSRKPGGDHPEIGKFMGHMFDVRKDYENVITKGSYIPLEVEKNRDDHIIAYARHLNGKTLLVVANRNVNGYETGSVKIPNLKRNQKLNDLSQSYGMPSTIKVDNESLKVELGPARFHLFEIDTPDIEQYSNEVYRPHQRITSSVGLLKKFLSEN